MYESFRELLLGKYFNYEDIDKNIIIIKYHEKFLCIKCNKLFKRKKHLKRHYNVHIVEKKYFCVYCNRLFLRKDYLNKHYQKSKKCYIY